MKPSPKGNDKKIREDFSFGPTTKVSPKRPSSETELVCSKRMSFEDPEAKDNQTFKNMDSQPCIDLDFQVIEEHN